MKTGFIKASHYKFDDTNRIFEKLSPMKVKRVAHSLVYSNKNGGEIYCIGGLTNDNVRTRLCEKYNIMKNLWIEIASMYYGKSRSACLNIDDKFIYSFYGTTSGRETLTIIEKYDIDNNKWIEITI